MTIQEQIRVLNKISKDISDMAINMEQTIKEDRISKQGEGNVNISFWISALEKTTHDHLKSISQYTMVDE